VSPGGWRTGCSRNKEQEARKNRGPRLHGKNEVGYHREKEQHGIINFLNSYNIYLGPSCRFDADAGVP